MTDLWTRLKQRKLVQWAVAYVAFAFALLQGVDIVAQQFAWPESVRRGITLALALGFFVTLLLAWYHGEQGRQRVSGTELLLLALVLGFGSAFLWWVAGQPPASSRVQLAASQSSVAHDVAAPSAGPVSETESIPQKSIAVLPFANESGDKSEQFFSDGLSEDLITALSQFAGLKVINSDSSFKFRDSHDSVSTIAGKLGVARLLQGGVRRLGDEVRIRAELVNAADGSTQWSQHYDRPYKDLFKLQDDITVAVADALKTRLLASAEGSAQSDRPPSGNLDAYTAYLKAMAQPRTEAGLRRAIALLQQAHDLDRNYATAYAVEATGWRFLADLFLGGEQAQDANTRARQAANTALRIDPGLGRAHYARAYLLLSADFDWNGALREARRVLQLAPHGGFAYSIMRQTLAAVGQTDAAIDVGRQRVAHDPLNAGAHESLALLLWAAGQGETAEAALRRAIELAPQDSRMHANLALIRAQRGETAAALAAARSEPPGFWHDFAIAIALQVGDDRQAADAALKHLIDDYADNGAYQIAEVQALRKNPDAMFHWLTRAWAQRDPGIQHLLTDPLILRYKDDPRFAAYCRTVGLPVPAANGAASD
ncbi:MAG: tetratricopeptide repeat protein [Rudaea sp.]